MRRILIPLHMLLILALSFALVHAQSGGVEAVVTSRAKLRAGPGTDWAILGVVEAGQPFRIDGRAPYETLWVRGITIDGRIGWIFGDLVSAPPDQLSALPTVWVDDPFSLTPPAAAPAPSEDTSPGAAAINANLISGITATSRRIYQAGQALGNRANVFSKVGDSITASPYFLNPIGWGAYNLRGYGSLQRVVNFFRAGDARDGNNSFANPSLAAYNGITTSGILNPNNAWAQVCQSGESPLECEYRLVRPAVALIMLGTNDVASLSPDDYRSNLSRIVQITVDRGIIPVLSLIPPRQGYESSIPTFNQIIADVAHNFDTPLWNFPAAISGLENGGLGDGVHPSVPPAAPDDYSAAADFSADNLRYGYTVRNLTALQILDAVWRRAMY